MSRPVRARTRMSSRRGAGPAASPQRRSINFVHVRHTFFSASRPLVFAHRGGAALAPENTIAAFDHGLALGADGIELDVRLSHDGVVVVHHHRMLERTTRLTGPVEARTAAELVPAEGPSLASVPVR